MDSLVAGEADESMRRKRRGVPLTSPSVSKTLSSTSPSHPSNVFRRDGLMSDQRDNVLFLGSASRSLDAIPLATGFKHQPASAMAARSVHYPPPGPYHPTAEQLAHRLAPVHSLHHPLYHPAASSSPAQLPYLYSRDGHYAIDRSDPYHAERFARHDLPEAMSQQQHQQQQGSGPSPAPRRRPSLLPANPTSDFAYPPYIQSPYPVRYTDSERFGDIQMYERNKSHAAAQPQQPLAAAPAASSQQGRSVLAMASHVTPQQLHHMGNNAGHRQLVSSTSALSGSRQPQPVAHHAYEQDSESAPKRPRLIAEQKPSLHQPLHIDTRDVSEMGKKPAYTPQVEAISPTPNDDARHDLSPFKSTKDDLVQNINRIDREISEAEIQIAKLRKKQLELEAASKHCAEGSEVPEPATDSKQQSVAQLVYSDNRKKAQMTHSLLDRISGVPASSMNLTSLLPLYNQPSDIASYHMNKEKFRDLKPKLMAMLRKQREHERARERFLTHTYDRLSTQWRDKVESRDTNPSRKSKDSKLRDFFEKQFPELRKQREDKERLSRAGQRIRSDADMEDIMEGLQEQEAEDKKMRSYAVVPPILQDKKYARPVFINRNNLIEDPMAEYKERRHVNVWTCSEKDIFREKFLQHPKNFGLISSYLEKKSVRDCVQYYYSSKKSENYKQLLRKHVKKRTRALVKQQQAAANAAAAASSKTASSLARQTPSAAEAEASSTPAVSAIQTAVLTEQRSLISSVADKRSVMMEEFKLSEKDSEQSSADTRLCHECFICKSRVESLSKSRPITKANCHHYGIAAETLTGEPRACLDCRFKYIRKQCLIPSCKTPERKIKRLKSLPQKWFDLNPEERRSLADKLNIPVDVKKGCTRCIMRVARAVGVSTDQLIACHDIWNDDEVSLLRKLLKEHGGRNWNLIAESMKGKNRKECKNFYYNNKLKYKLDSDLKTSESNDSDEYWNDMTDDSEETSSADEGNGRSTSDTASAPSPSAAAAAASEVTGPGPFSSSSSRPPEGLIAQRQQRVPSFLINPNAPSTTNSVNRSHPIVNSAPAAKEEPTCVRDLIYQAIEMSLQGPSKTPDKPVPAPPQQSQLSGMPAGYHEQHHQRSRDPYAEQKSEMHLSPNSAAQDARHAGHYTPQSSLTRPEGLMMSYSHQLMNATHRQTPVLMENEVQDLSKKNTSFREPARSQTPQSRKDRPVTPSTYPYQSMPPPAHSNMDMAGQLLADGRRSTDFYPEQSRNLKPAHAGPIPRTVIPRPPPRTPTSSGRPLVPPPPLIATSPSPKPKDSRGAHPVGSITQGTPVTINTSQGVMMSAPYGHHYDALMRSHPMGPKEATGSIMLGTPVHQDAKRKGDLRMGPYEVTQREQFYRRPSPNPQPPPHSGSPMPRTMYPGIPDAYVSMAKGEKAMGQSPSPLGAMAMGSKDLLPEPHPSTNQLLIDFNTSKQMLARRGSSGEGKDSPHAIRGRESSSPQIPNPSRMQAIYTPHTGAPHLHSTNSIYTPSLADRSFYPVDRSNAVTTISSPGSQIRQNVIQSWPQKGTSVIQSTKTASPRSDQRSDVSSPHSFARKSFQQMPYNPLPMENFQTLVNAAAAQQSLTVPANEPKMADRRLLPPHGHIKNESESRSPKSPKDQRLEHVDMRRPPSHPDWSDADPNKQARDRVRKIYMSMPEDGRKQELSGPFLSASPGMYQIHGQPQMNPYREHYANEQADRQQVDAARRMLIDSRNPHLQLSKQQRAELDQEASRLFSQSFQKDHPAAPPAQGPTRFTAANLIDAIITHQINQPVDGKGGQQSAEPAIADHPKPEKMTEDILHANQRLMHSVVPQSRSHESQMYSHSGPTTLGDHISSIISRSFSDKSEGRPLNPHLVRPEDRRPLEGIAAAAASTRPPESQMRSGPAAGEGGRMPGQVAGTSWKLRRALQQERDEEKPVPRSDSSRPSSRSSSVSSQHVLSANLEPISPPPSSTFSEDTEPGADAKRVAHEPISPPAHRSPCRSAPPGAPDRPSSASHQSLDRTPPALEILEDMGSGETNWTSEEVRHKATSESPEKQ